MTLTVERHLGVTTHANLLHGFHPFQFNFDDALRLWNMRQGWYTALKTRCHAKDTYARELLAARLIFAQFVPSLPHAVNRKPLYNLQQERSQFACMGDVYIPKHRNSSISIL